MKLSKRANDIVKVVSRSLFDDVDTIQRGFCVPYLTVTFRNINGFEDMEISKFSEAGKRYSQVFFVPLSDKKLIEMIKITSDNLYKSGI